MTNAIPTDFENIRTMEEFREQIENEIASLRRGGITNRDIGLWLAGARWAVRIMQPKEARRAA